MKNIRESGISLVEVVVAAAIVTAFLAAIVGVYNLHLKVITGSSRQVKAAFLAEETIEAVKYLRNISWNTYIQPLTLENDYYLVWQNGKWEVSTTNAYIDGELERKFRLSSVNRDSQSNIVESGGTLDPQTKKLTATVSWAEGSGTTTRAVSTYITNIFDN